MELSKENAGPVIHHFNGLGAPITLAEKIRNYFFCVFFSCLQSEDETFKSSSFILFTNPYHS